MRHIPDEVAAAAGDFAGAGTEFSAGRCAARATGGDDFLCAVAGHYGGDRGQFSAAGHREDIADVAITVTKVPEQVEPCLSQHGGKAFSTSTGMTLHSFVLARRMCPTHSTTGTATRKDFSASKNQPVRRRLDTVEVRSSSLLVPTISFNNYSKIWEQMLSAWEQ